MSEQQVWVRFTVVTDDPKDARLKVRRALKTISVGSGCTEATVFDRTPTEADIAQTTAPVEDAKTR
jgi:hypothetical protein